MTLPKTADERRLRQLGEAILAELRELNQILSSILRCLPIEPIIDPGAEHLKADRDPEDKRGYLWVRSETQFPSELVSQYKADQNEARELHRKSHKVQIWLLVATAGAFLSASTYAFIAYFQLRTTDSALEEVKKQTKAAFSAADAAQDGLKMARENFRHDQRPYIWLTNELGSPRIVSPRAGQSATGQVIWTYHFTNYGKSPALNVRFYQYIKIGDRGFTSSYGAKEEHRGAPLPPNQDSIATVVSDEISREEFNQLLIADERISTRIRFVYSDSYAENYETGICLTRLHTGAIGYCKDGNYIK